VAHGAETGHWVHESEPEWFVDALRSFLEC
jgi:pimeloyl-ACP methyl ester carboxylesterase